jgi:pimeloyl-ACP methyl ester carboxylesterase
MAESGSSIARLGAHLSDALNTEFATFLARSIEQPGASREVLVNGIRIHYLEWAGPTQAPTIVLFHGFLAHAHWWDFIAPWLAKQYRVIAPDFSGMGDSAYREVYSEAAYQEEILSFVEQVIGPTCTAIGHSFGGRALLYACAQRPEQFARAIVVDSRLGSADDPIRGFDEEWRPKKRYVVEQEILSRFLLRPPEPAPDAALAHIARASVKQDGDSWVWKFDENVTRLFQARRNSPGVNDAERMTEMRTPVDFIYGEESRVVTPARAALLPSCLPNVRSVTGLPQSHHHLSISQPIALLAALRILLQQKLS